MAQMKACWDREDDERRRRHVAEIEAIVAVGRAYVERQNALEAEIQRRKDYYEAAHKDEADQERRRLLTRLEKATKEIRKSDVRAERQELFRRGVVRGTRLSLKDLVR